jgi:hypothetical protein
MRYPQFEKQGFCTSTGVVESGCNAECIVIPSLISESLRFRYFERFSLRIKERVVREAINLSLARKRPDLSFGGVIASSACSFCADPRGASREHDDPLDRLAGRRGGHYYADYFRFEEAYQQRKPHSFARSSSPNSA